MTEIVLIHDPEDAQRELFDAWAGVRTASARHVFGDDHSAWTPDQLRVMARGTDRRRIAWVALDGDEVVGALGLDMPLHDNLSVAGITVDVLPGRRRRGIGSALLEVGEAQARAHGRSVLLTETQWLPNGRDESGEGFFTRHGYAAAQTVLRSSLSLPADRARLDAALAADGSDGYDVRSCWDGLPEEWLQGRAELSRRMSTDVPLGDLQLEEERWDSARVRAEYERIASMGRRVVDTFAVEEETGRLVGYTQVQVTTAEPEVAYQQDTLVMREHRGHRLGLRMKAASTLELMASSPASRVVRTWNADDNAPMLAVNGELGYVRDALLREWQKVTPSP